MKVAYSTALDLESELVEKLRSGDMAAIEKFYNTYRSRLYNLVFEQVGGDQAATEDLVQEIFLAALNSIDRFRGDSQLYTWLYSIAHHKVTDFHRRRAKESRPWEQVPNGHVIKPEQIADNEQLASSTLEAEETRDTIQQALVDLPQDYQQVLVLKYFDEMPVQEISQLMDRSPKSVEGLLSRARNAMRVSLARVQKI